MSISIQISEKRKRQCAKLVELSKAVIREAFDKFDPEELGITWTGGKDSGLALWCVRQVCIEQNRRLPRTLIIGEVDEFKEIEDFIQLYAKRWNVPLDVRRNEDVLKAANYSLGAMVRLADINERNRKELERIGFREEEFPFEAESYTGNHLMKTVVFNEWLELHGIRAAIEGLRWDEHPARFDDEYFEHVEGSSLGPEHTKIRPILHFTERDLWTSYAAFNIPFCSLYEQGYRSLGTISTSLKNSDKPAWEQDLDNTDERNGRRQDREKAIESLRKLGYM